MSCVDQVSGDELIRLASRRQTMDAIRDFFQQHGAVPANDAGPQWDKASDEALLHWAEQDCETWDRCPNAHPRLYDRMKDIHDELMRRSTGLGDVFQEHDSIISRRF